MSNYTTGEVARICGVSVRTVQYYDNRGLLSPSELTEGGRRLYSDDDLKQMKIICYLRELDFSIDNITKLLNEKNSKNVISLLIEEQLKLLENEINEKKEKLEGLKSLHSMLKRGDNISLDSIADVAHIMENKKNLKKMRTIMVLACVPIGILEWGSIILWALTGIWWPFLVYTALAIPFAIWLTRYYYKRVAYICPECHEVFVPKVKEFFFAGHTPNTRKLTCPKCGYRGYCVETYRDPQK